MPSYELLKLLELQGLLLQESALALQPSRIRDGSHHRLKLKLKQTNNPSLNSQSTFPTR